MMYVLPDGHRHAGRGSFFRLFLYVPPTQVICQLGMTVLEAISAVEPATSGRNALDALD